jgi:hypothetical protein
MSLVPFALVRTRKNKDFDPSALPAFGRSYTAPESTFIRSVITTPAVDQSDLMEPPSADSAWPAVVLEGIGSTVKLV